MFLNQTQLDRKGISKRLLTLFVLGFSLVAAFYVMSRIRIGVVSAFAEEGLSTVNKEVSVIFSGNSSLSERELRNAASEEFETLSSSSYLNALAEDAAFLMEMTYRNQGFAFASVVSSVETGERSTIIRFTVEEGPQVLIGTLTFLGNTIFSHEDLLSQFNANGNGKLFTLGDRKIFVESSVSGGLSRVKELYYSKGYQDVTIDAATYIYSEDKTSVDITIGIHEGTQYVIQAVEFFGDLFSDAALQYLNLKNKMIGLPYLPRRKLELRSNIAEIYANLGYPEVQVDVQFHELEDKGRVLLSADIASGPQIMISRYIFQGNEKTDASFLENRMRLKPGKIFSIDRKRESFQELYHTGLFSKIEMELIPDDEENKRALAVNLREYPSKEIYGEIGWGSYELLRLRAGFKENNLFGKGRVFRSEVGGSLKSEDVLFKLTDPWFLGSSLSADIPVYYQRREEPSYKSKESGISFSLTKEFKNNIVASIAYLHKRTSITDVEVSESIIEELNNNYNLGSLKFQATLDNRDDIFWPTSGYKAFFSEEYSDKFMGSEIKYLRTSGGVRYFRIVAKDVVLGVRYDTGLTVPVRDQTELPLAERFYNGGENSVRSFRQDLLGPKDLSGDPVGGMAYNVFSLEVRKKMSGNLSISLFADTGNLSPNKSRIEEGKGSYGSRAELVNATLDDYFSDFRSALGVGFQYLLPVGPARLDIAVNPDKRPDNDERDYAIHFSIGMAF